MEQAKTHIAEPPQPAPFDPTTFQFKRILKIVIALSIAYLVLITVSIPTLTIIAVIFACLSLLIKIKLGQIREKGPQNFSPKLRQLLFQKSIFDVYSDIIYFPTISRIIAAFIKPALAKPEPELLKNSFENIHPKAKQIISTKGLINIFPNKVRAICHKQDEPLPPVVRNWQWIHTEKYKSHEQVHQDTLKKRIIDRVDTKINWKTLSGMAVIVALGIKMMGPQRAKRMLIQNGCFAGGLVVVLIGLIKLSRKGHQNLKHSHLEIEARVVEE